MIAHPPPHGCRQRATIAPSRSNRAKGTLPIPLLFGIDAVHGHRNIVGATLFPHNIGLGAAHDPELVRRIGVATAEAVAATGIDWAFAPTIAVPQDIRWGRSYEGYAQDPALVRQYAQAAVEGLQGPAELSNKLQAGRVAASAKHFLGDGGTAGGVDQGDTQVSEGELIRLHAQGYVSAIDAGVLTVMASYSSWKARRCMPIAACSRMYSRAAWDSRASSSAIGTATRRCPDAVAIVVRRLSTPASTCSWRPTTGSSCTTTRSRRHAPVRFLLHA